MATFTNATKHSTTFTNQALSAPQGGIFGDLTFDQIGAETFDGMYHGKLIGDWKFDDPLGTQWSNATRN